MGTLRLSPEGLFPLASPPHEPLSRVGLPQSGTLQGEGLLCGVPSLFLRLAGCNLRCQWTGPNGEPIPCDTPHALSDSQARQESTLSLAQRIAQHLGPLTHLVITGGEPLLQAEGLVELIDHLQQLRPQRMPHITVESNGTIYHDGLARLIDLISLSPKLQPIAPGGTLGAADCIAPLQQWLDACPGAESLQLKFVVGHAEDDQRIEALYLSRLRGWEGHPLFVMPVGRTPDEMAESQQAALAIAVRRNWRFAIRLQLHLWGNRPGT